MQQDILQNADKYTQTRQRKRRLHKIFTCLAVAVAFCTINVLILPAITMEKNQCEIPEHTHSEFCYTQVTSVTRTEPVCTLKSLNIHQHTADCYDENGEAVCGYADVVVHQHDLSCFDEDGNLWCPLPEILPHTHDESCFAAAESAEAEEPAEPKQICGKEEIILHEHIPECFDDDNNLICGKTQVLEHIHSDACFRKVEEPADTKTLTCTLSEDENHTHGPLCYGTWELACTLPEHTHGPGCADDSTMDGQNQPACGPEEQISTEICGEQPETATTEQPEDGAASLTHIQGDFPVAGNVLAAAGADTGTDVGPDDLPVDYYVCIDGQWVCVGSTDTGWYNNWDGAEDWTDYNRDYITVAQAVSVLGPYGFTGEEANPSLVTAYQQKQEKTVYSDTNTVEIGGQKVLPLSRNFDCTGYNLYYLPGNTAQIHGASDSDKLDKAANGFYSVRVVDDSSSVYSKPELQDMVQHIRSGGTAAVTVKNAEGVLWSCVGKNGDVLNVDKGDSEDSATITFEIASITQPVEIIASRSNPSFAVQYYAWMDMVTDSGAKVLNVIDTTGGKLPQNYSSAGADTEPPIPASLRSIYLNGDGTLATAPTLLEVYTGQNYEYMQAPDAVNFNLTADYTGPLEYYFYGDDDMWVFLDGKLVCDIGGIHSTVGEYINLWDYIAKGDEGSHTLAFFYTERGASGSTCYMRFTMPSVSSATLSGSHGDLAISKEVNADGCQDVSYQFQVDLLTQQDGPAIGQTCRYAVTGEGEAVTYGTLKSGGTLSLKKGQTATISGIPAGTYYSVTELTTAGYLTTVNGSEGYIASGLIVNGNTQTAKFVNTPCYELPSTGGAGTILYTMGGLLLMAVAGTLLLYCHKMRRKGESASS